MYSLEVQVLSDSHSYSETMAVIDAMEPNEILLHDGTRSSTLSQKLARAAQQQQRQYSSSFHHHHDTGCASSSNNNSSSSSNSSSSNNSSSNTGGGFRILYINRQYFDQDRGADLLRRVCVRSIDSELVSKYIVLGACFCLLKYMESITGQVIAPHSLRIDSLGLGGCDSESTGRLNAPHSSHMHMDRRTASNLEVTQNSRSGRQKESLFGAINYTRTVVGARLLRANLLRPITDIPTLNMRLDAVDVLIAGTLATTDLSDILVKFPDLDKTLSGLATAGHSSRAESVTINKANGTCTSSSTNPRAVKLAIDTLIYVKHSIQQGRQLADTLHRIIAQCNASSSDASACTRNPYAADMNGASLSVDREAESSAKAALLNCIERNLRDPSLSTILDAIVALLTEGAAYSRASHEMRHQECFAVRAGVHTFLDVSRSAFLQTVGEIHDKASLYAEELNTEVRVAFSSSRGYFLQIHLSSDRDASTILPRMFIQAVQNRRVVSCTTNELLSLSSRALEAIETALRITSDLVQDLLAWIRGYSDVLFVFVDSIALLDMLQSFAELVHSCPHVMARPRLTQGGALVIKEGRHPIMSLLGNRHGCSRTAGNIVRDGLPFVPNDTYISDTEAFQIVTGGNGAGKSTYIKQVALLCILAQVGCYVPAAYMLLPVRTRLHSRIGTGDDMEHNMSTFHTEMRECGYILDMTNRSCLVIIDELGRGTANAEGLSIAMAVAEALVASGAMTLFVTHFAQLTALEDVYPAAVCNVHLGSSPRIEMSDGGRSGQAIEGDIGGASERELNDEGDAGSHKMCTGPSPLRSGYGLMAAQRCGIPAEVMGVASALHRRLKQLHPLMLDVNVEQRSVAALQSLLGSMSVLRSSTLDYAGIRFYLSTLAKKLNDSEREGLLHTLDTLTKPHRCKASVSSSDGISVIVSEQSCSRSAAPEIETRPEALCTDDKENVESLTAHQPRYIAGIDTKGQRFSLTELDSSTDLSTTALDSTDEKAYKRARISVAYTPNITIT